MHLSIYFNFDLDQEFNTDSTCSFDRLNVVACMKNEQIFSVDSIYCNFVQIGLSFFDLLPLRAFDQWWLSEKRRIRYLIFDWNYF